MKLQCDMNKYSNLYLAWKVEQIQPFKKFCKGLISTTVHMVFGVYMCHWILFLCFLISVYMPNCAMQRLQHAFLDTSSKIRTTLHYRSQLDVLIWHQLDMFGTYEGCPYSLVTHPFYPQHIVVTNQSSAWRLIGHIWCYLAIKHGTNFKDFDTKIALVTTVSYDPCRAWTIRVGWQRIVSCYELVDWQI